MTGELDGRVVGSWRREFWRKLSFGGRISGASMAGGCITMRMWFTARRDEVICFWIHQIFSWLGQDLKEKKCVGTQGLRCL